MRQEPALRDASPTRLCCGQGGFALDADDFEDSRAFVQAGLVLMPPHLAREDANSRVFELYYGEVDDACEALNYLAKRPEVDAKRIYRRLA
jgi:hypothetical protein